MISFIEYESCLSVAALLDTNVWEQHPRRYSNGAAMQTQQAQGSKFRVVLQTGHQQLKLYVFAIMAMTSLYHSHKDFNYHVII